MGNDPQRVFMAMQDKDKTRSRQFIKGNMKNVLVPRMLYLIIMHVYFHLNLLLLLLPCQALNNVLNIIRQKCSLNEHFVFS